MTTLERVHGEAAPQLSLAAILTDGLYAGVIGAAVVALWFFIIDWLAGRPLHTPYVLGTLLLRGAAGVAEGPADAGTVAAYTSVHVVAFVAVGMVAAYLVALFDRYPAAGIALVFLFAFFEVGFFVVSAALGGGLLGRLGPWAVGIGNLLAAAAMAFYFWKRHPRLRHSWGRILEE
jgi:hypothetical protein